MLVGAGLAALPAAAHAALSWSGPVSVYAHHKLASVSCPSPTQCTAVNSDGYESTFDPAPGGPAARTLLIDNCDPSNFTCPCDPTQGPCTDGSVGVTSVDCPSETECVAVDYDGAEVDFNPQPGGTVMPPQEIDAGGHGSADLILALACPALHQCTGVDDITAAVTFNPVTARSQADLVDYRPKEPAMTGIACPTANQCTAVDNQGYEVTFNPLRLHRDHTPVRIERGGWLNAVACPTATQCTAVDRHGNVTTFNPLTPHPKTVAVVNAGMNGIACPSKALCVIADRHGQVDVGKPGGKWKVTPISPSTRLEAVSCVSTSECVVVDSAGNAFVGR